MQIFGFHPRQQPRQHRPAGLLHAAGQPGRRPGLHRPREYLARVGAADRSAADCGQLSRRETSLGLRVAGGRVGLPHDGRARLITGGKMNRAVRIVIT